MNSLIHFSQSPVSVAQEGLSSASRVHVSLLNHGSLSVSQWCKRSQLVSRPLYVKCTLERFSEGPKMKEENEKKKNNIMRGVGKASLVMACVLGAFTLSGKQMNLKPNIAYAACCQEEEGSVTAPLKKLMTPDFFEREPDGNEIEALKLYAMVVSKDNPKWAQEILSRERQCWLGGEADNKLLMALVELLVYQRKYPEAKRKIDELLEDGPAGLPMAKVHLLKAIAESKMDPKNAEKLESEANKAWRDYLDTLSSDPFSVKSMAIFVGDQDGSPMMEKSFPKTVCPSKALKSWAMVLSMKKHWGDVAENIMSEECERFKNKPVPHTLQLALIESLLDQGEYKDAKEKINKLLDDIGPGPADVPMEQVHLLKAIAESGRDPKEAEKPKSEANKAFEQKKKKANKAWEDYLRKLSDPFKVTNK